MSEKDLGLKPYLENVKDLEQCETLLEEFLEDVKNGAADELERVSFRLNLLEKRVERIVVTDLDDDKNIKPALQRQIQTLKEEIEKRRYTIWKSGELLKNKERRSTLNPQLGGGVLPDLEDEAGEEKRSEQSKKGYSSMSAPPVSNPHVGNLPRPKPALYKWGISFSGDDRRQSASEFLQRVSDFAHSRLVSGEELLSSISDILDGSALKWFRRKRESLTSYQQFVESFLREFEPYQQSERLLEFIRTRKQKPNETITQYIAFMEDQFLRLPHVPSERYRTKIIRNNLLPVYIRAISLIEFQTVDDLSDACRKIEDSEAQANFNS